MYKLTSFIRTYIIYMCSLMYMQPFYILSHVTNNINHDIRGLRSIKMLGNLKQIKEEMEIPKVKINFIVAGTSFSND